MIKFHQKFFLEPIPLEDINPDQIDLVIIFLEISTI